MGRNCRATKPTRKDKKRNHLQTVCSIFTRAKQCIWANWENDYRYDKCYITFRKYLWWSMTRAYICNDIRKKYLAYKSFTRS